MCDLHELLNLKTRIAAAERNNSQMRRIIRELAARVKELEAAKGTE